MTSLLLLHAALAGLALLFPRLGRRALVVMAAAPASVAVWLGANADRILDGGTSQQRIEWVPELGLTLTLRLDALGWLMGALISGIGILVLLYAASYLHDGPGAARLGALLLLFAASMLGLVWSDDLLGLFVFWEATTVVSFLLVGFTDRSADARAAAWQALLVTGAGGLALLFGLVTLGIVGGSWSLDELAADPPPTTAAVAAAAIGVLVAAFTKSAQVPFHGWLLGAMAAPTPVSAYLHSATMVTAGVWLTLRLDPVFADLAWWHPTLLVVGGATALWGAWRALAAVDLKRLLAYSTISVLGAMFALIGIGTPKSSFAAVAVLAAHALYKAALFMGVGAIDHQCGTRDLRELGGLRRSMPTLALSMGLAGLSMAAVPAFAGFVAKEAGVVAALDGPTGSGAAAIGVLVVSGALAVAYGWRLWSGSFGGPTAPGADTRPPGVGLVGPVAVLAALGLVLGLAPAGWSGWTAAAAGAARPASAAYELIAWPGWGTALAISLATVVAGSAIAVVESRRRRAHLDAPTTRGGFEATLGGLFRLANRITAIAQPGSLPLYVAVIVVVAIGPATVVALTGDDLWPDRPLAADLPQAVLVGIVVVAAIAVAAIRTRLAAVMALGIVGYGVAGLFWVQGAPDLALTQALVETVVVAAFVLVLRRLPRRLPRPTAPRWIAAGRVAVAGAVGVGVAVLAATAAGPDREAPTPTPDLLAGADPIGGGDNVVNVVLTDTRALDTMGEITVVAAAAIGALALAGLARRRLGPAPDAGDVDPAGTVDLRPQPSVVLDTLMRAMFPLIAAFSLFMLAAGHNAPGGGFIAGLIAGAAIALRLLAGDWIRPLDRPRWLQPQPLMGAGLAVAVATLVAGGLSGGFGDQTVATWDLPLVGEVKATSALVFDVGVYLLVIGATTAILDALAARTEQVARRDGTTPAEDEPAGAAPVAGGRA